MLEKIKFKRKLRTIATTTHISFPQELLTALNWNSGDDIIMYAKEDDNGQYIVMYNSNNIEQDNKKEDVCDVVETPSD